MHEITMNGRTFELHSITGTVAGATKHLETKVSGGGGGGSSYHGTGYTAPVRIQSTTVTHDQLFLVDGDGAEHALQLQNWNLACRDGHVMTAVSLIRKGKGTGPYVAIRNTTTNDTQYDDKTLARLFRPWWPLLALVALVVLRFSALSFVIVIAALSYWWYLGIKARNEVKASGQLFALM